MNLHVIGKHFVNIATSKRVMKRGAFLKLEEDTEILEEQNAATRTSPRLFLGCTFCALVVP